HELFEAQVERTPEAIAVVQEIRQLSYGELNARANRLAAHLRGLGVGPDTRVAICMEKNLEMVVGLLAVVKAGAAYVPLDPSHPAERLRSMIENSAPRVLLIDATANSGLSGRTEKMPVLNLTDDVAQWSVKPAHNLGRANVGLTPGHLAYAIYTS